MTSPWPLWRFKSTAFDPLVKRVFKLTSMETSNLVLLDPPHKWSVTQKRFPWNDVAMITFYRNQAIHRALEESTFFSFHQSDPLWVTIGCNERVAQSLASKFFVRYLKRQNIRVYTIMDPGPLFTKCTDVSPQDLLKYRSHEIRVHTFPIDLKFERHSGSTIAKLPIEFHIDTIIITTNHAASRLQEIWRWDGLSLSE